MRVSEAMAKAGIDSKGRAIEESWIEATCPECKTAQRLDAVELRESGEQTEYLCGSCEAVFATVGPAPGLTGYRIGDYVFNPLGGMNVHVPPVE